MPFAVMAEKILGKAYELSVAIVTPDEIQKINLMYRNKDEPTDILSFPLSENQGEIYLCPEEIKKESVKFDRSYENFFAFVFIHGCVHLKGYDHGGTMEGIEAQFRNTFGI
ncbi:MAG: rRNA maturation RNase YbeY [Patescibacteria group bacterium]